MKKIYKGKIMKNLVIGSGLSGAVMANLIADKLDEEVLVIEKKNHIGGNCYDYRDKNGIMVQKYGPHAFHTNNEQVWQFLQKFSKFNQYMHRVIAVIDGIEVPIPFNLNTLYKVFPETLAKKLEEKLLSKFEYNTKVPILEFIKQDDEDLKFLANYIYKKVFLGYTIKQWGVKPEDIDISVTERVPVVISRDDRYFQDKYQGIPLEGYSKMISNMLKHKNIKIKLNTTMSDINPEKFDRILYTGAIDEFFNYEFGKLSYRSLKFEFEEHNCEFYQSNVSINYPCNYDFTRIHEYKYFLRDKSNKTVIAKEYPETFLLGKNERFYPIPNSENEELYEKYKQKAQKIENLYIFGRLGDYKYYNMDKAIERVFEIFDKIKSSQV